MINVLIPLVFGLLLLYKPNIFIKKNSENFETKRAKFAVIGKILLGVAILFFLGSLFIRMGAPDDNAIISGSVRVSFVRGFEDSCKQKLINNPRNSSFSSSVINEYCSCSAKEIADQTTYGEIKLINANSAVNQSYSLKMNSVTAPCDNILQGAR